MHQLCQVGSGSGDIQLAILNPNSQSLVLRAHRSLHFQDYVATWAHSACVTPKPKPSKFEARAVACRNAFDWTASMSRHPWHATNHCNTTFLEFMQREWSPGKLAGEACAGDAILFFAYPLLAISHQAGSR